MEETTTHTDGSNTKTNEKDEQEENRYSLALRKLETKRSETRLAGTMRRVATGLQALRKTLSLKPLRMPISYTTYKETNQTDMELVCARRLDAPQRKVETTYSGVAVVGGKGIRKEGDLRVRQLGITKIFRDRTPHFVCFGAEALEVYIRSDQYEPLEETDLLHLIRFVEIRAVQYQTPDQKEFIVVFGCVEGNSADQEKGEYKVKSLVFTAESPEEAQEWLKAILIACINVALYLTECLDFLIENNKVVQPGVKLDLHRQIVDLVEIARGQFHSDSSKAQERYAAQLFAEDDMEEGEFWSQRAFVCRQKARSRLVQDPNGAAPAVSGLEMVQNELAKSYSSIFEINVNNRASRRKSRASFTAGTQARMAGKEPLQREGKVKFKRPKTKSLAARERRLRTTNISDTSSENGKQGEFVDADEYVCSLMLLEDEGGKMKITWSQDAVEDCLMYYIPGNNIKIPVERIEKPLIVANSLDPEYPQKKFFKVMGSFISDVMKERAELYINNTSKGPYSFAAYGISEGNVTELASNQPLELAEFDAYAIVPGDFQFFRERKVLPTKRFVELGKNTGTAKQLYH